MLKPWHYAVLWTIFSAILLLVPIKNSSIEVHWWGQLPLDKGVHLVLFFVFAMLWKRFFTSILKLNWKAKLATLIFGVLWAAISEGLQGTLNWGRDASVADLIADGIGLIFALLFIAFKQQKLYIKQ